ncbi:MAG: hypothetical protein AAGB00_13535 [Planctomycetota bacterium]
MPFSMLQLVLGAAFLLVWLFIAATMLGDRLAEVRRRRVSAALEAGDQAVHAAPKAKVRRRSRRNAKRQTRRAVAGA